MKSEAFKILYALLKMICFNDGMLKKWNLRLLKSSMRIYAYLCASMRVLGYPLQNKCRPLFLAFFPSPASLILWVKTGKRKSFFLKLHKNCLNGRPLIRNFNWIKFPLRGQTGKTQSFLLLSSKFLARQAQREVVNIKKVDFS